YSCNPSGAHANSAEIIRFDDQAKMFRFSEIDFAEPAATRVHENPHICQTCHAPNFRDIDPRPNWQMYFTWDGVYGMHDDQLGASAPDFTNGVTDPVFFFSVLKKPP